MQAPASKHHPFCSRCLFPSTLRCSCKTIAIDEKQLRRTPTTGAETATENNAARCCCAALAHVSDGEGASRKMFAVDWESKAYSKRRGTGGSKETIHNLETSETLDAQPKESSVVESEKKEESCCWCCCWYFPDPAPECFSNESGFVLKFQRILLQATRKTH